MKIRAGLVSNSSSASFLLAVDTQKKLDLLQLILKGVQQRSFKNAPWLYGKEEACTVADLKRHLTYSIERLEKYKTHREKALKFLLSILNKPTARQAIATWIEIAPDKSDLYIDPTTLLSRIKFESSYSETSIKAHLDDAFEAELYRQNGDLEQIEENIKEATSILETIPMYDLSDETLVLVVEVDNGDTQTIRKTAQALDIPTLHEVYT